MPAIHSDPYPEEIYVNSRSSYVCGCIVSNFKDASILDIKQEAMNSWDKEIK